jgi:hypothetical protein
LVALKRLKRIASCQKFKDYLAFGWKNRAKESNRAGTKVENGWPSWSAGQLPQAA